MAADKYKTLGVSRDATSDEIRSAYLHLARIHHPDLNPGNEEAETVFKAIQLAYETLVDPKSRLLYDQGKLREPVVYSQHPYGHNNKWQDHNAYDPNFDINSGVGHYSGWRNALAMLACLVLIFSGGYGLYWMNSATRVSAALGTNEMELAERIFERRLSSSIDLSDEVTDADELTVATKDNSATVDVSAALVSEKDTRADDSVQFAPEDALVPGQSFDIDQSDFERAALFGLGTPTDWDANWDDVVGLPTPQAEPLENSSTPALSNSDAFTDPVTLDLETPKLERMAATVGVGLESTPIGDGIEPWPEVYSPRAASSPTSHTANSARRRSTSSAWRSAYWSTDSEAPSSTGSRLEQFRRQRGELIDSVTNPSRSYGNWNAPSSAPFTSLYPQPRNSRVGGNRYPYRPSIPPSSFSVNRPSPPGRTRGLDSSRTSYQPPSFQSRGYYSSPANLSAPSIPSYRQVIPSTNFDMVPRVH